MKYLLIDGNNLAIRCAFANADLKNADGIPTGVHFGVFQSIINLKYKFPDRQFLIVWDGKSVRRMQESEEGVKSGIIPSSYKFNRKKDEQPQPLKDFYSQIFYLQRGLGQTGIPQIRFPQYEADDVIASYCKTLAGNDIVVVTSDKDYWQLLTEHVSLWDGMKSQEIHLDAWQKEYGITPAQYVDVGALMGDDGDNIFGIPGWGEKTALKAIKKHGSWQEVLKEYNSIYNSSRALYKDLKDDPDGINKFTELSQAVSDKKKIVYPQIHINMPFTGVLYAFYKELIKGSKTEIMALVFEERIKLAYSLKKMDDYIDGLPEIASMAPDTERIKQYFSYYDIETLQDEINIFV